MVNTFVPYPDIAMSLNCLDSPRLGKQRVECLQLINALEGKTTGWRNHPACVMWENNLDALKLYHDVSLIVWKDRGYHNTMPMLCEVDAVEMPIWWGDIKVHKSHQSNLLRKDKEHYGRYNWKVPDNLPYVWPKS
jgi:hypothetical protein